MIDWPALIAEAALHRAVPVSAHSYRNRSWSSYSTPVLLGCDDGHDYVVKGHQLGKAIANEQIVGSLGRRLGCPVVEIRLVNVPKELIDAQPELAHLQPGVSHGCRFTPDCGDRDWLAHTDSPENRSRFAALAVLYGWTHACDRQLIYGLASPHLVYSVDHGHFFPSGPNWIATQLISNVPPEPFAEIVQACSLTCAELGPVIDRLRTVEPVDIAEAASAPPEHWAITVEERCAIAAFLFERQATILRAFSTKP